MDHEEFKREALRIIQGLLDGVDYAEDYAQNRDGFTIFNNDLVDAYDAGKEFIKTNLK